MKTVKDPATRREEILNAASELFIKEGYQNTTVESIVQKAGMAKGSFYNYFKSKEDVSEALISRMADHIITGVKEILDDQNMTPKQRINNFIDFTLRTATEQNVNMNQLDMSENNSTIKTMYVRASDDGARLLIPIISKTLDEGCKRGEFSLLDVYFTSAVIVGALQRIYTAFFEMQHTDVDVKSIKNYTYDFMSKLLCTNFEE